MVINPGNQLPHSPSTCLAQQCPQAIGKGTEILDGGLVCNLLGIQALSQLIHHPLRGAIFENWVVSELYKAHVHIGERPNMFHFRESRGPQIDLLIQRADANRARTAPCKDTGIDADSAEDNHSKS
jgi:predicted AAA+ superfamily ATPase